MPLVSIDFKRIFKSGLIVLLLLKNEGSILKIEDDNCFKTGSGIIDIGTYIMLDLPFPKVPVITRLSILGFSIIP